MGAPHRHSCCNALFSFGIPRSELSLFCSFKFFCLTLDGLCGVLRLILLSSTRLFPRLLSEHRSASRSVLLSPSIFRRYPHESFPYSLHRPSYLPDADALHANLSHPPDCAAACQAAPECVLWTAQRHLGCWLHHQPALAGSSNAALAGWTRLPCSGCTTGTVKGRTAPNVTASPRVPRPSPQQLAWLDDEVGAMVSWNLQTLCGNGTGFTTQQCQHGGTGFVPGMELVRQWNPDELDLDVWMDVAASFGAKYMGEKWARWHCGSGSEICAVGHEITFLTSCSPPFA